MYFLVCTLDKIILESAGFNYGVMVGMLVHTLRAFTKSGRDDLNDDFLDKMKKYEKVSNTD